MAGCSAMQDGSEETRLSDISFLNQNRQTEQLELQVQWDNELVYSETYEVHPTEDEKKVRTIRDEWPSEAGSFTVRARIEGDEKWETGEYPLKNREGSCYSIIVRIREDGTIDVPSSTDKELY